MNFFLKFTILIVLNLNLTAQVKQQNILRVDQMPNLPKPLSIIDYNKLSHSAVIVPANGKITYSGNKMLVNGIVVDYMKIKKQ